ncbi:MAG: hypothetical protein IT529_09550 [Burkholderiales bacterium]|nr:hypothetical protein [Burkholderiales bacterium]
MKRLVTACALLAATVWAATASAAAGEIDVIYTTTISSEPQIKANRVRAIGVASRSRVRLLPDVPTLQEFGIKNAEAQIWYGLQGPLNLPASVVARLNAGVNRALQAPDVRARLDQLGFEIAGGSPGEFDAVVKSEIGRIEKLLAAGLLRKEQ